MQRLSITPRNNWQQSVEDQGMAYHTIDGDVYWDESAYYQFSSAEIDTLEAATTELQKMCIAAAEHIIDKRLYSTLKIPDHAIPLIEQSWHADEPSMLGRFDLAFDGVTPPKMLEYNADTPTALLEASVIQWFWLKDRFPDSDQFNSIHEKLLAGWHELKQSRPHCETLYFCCADQAPEDQGNVLYLRDTAHQAGFTTDFLAIEEIGYDTANGRFVDLDNAPISHLFKLYPWEWLVADTFGCHISTAGTTFIEPAWKMLLSNKALLAVLWDMFPNHDNLLKATLKPGHFSDNYVSKPFLSREGSNITMHRNGSVSNYEGSYATDNMVYQQLAPLPCYNGNYPVIGSWIIGGEAAGIGIREDHSVVTTNCSRFIPHIFK